MVRVKPEPKDDAILALGDAPEEEYTFLLVPVAVYSIVSKISKERGLSVGQVFQKALLQYIDGIDSVKEPIGAKVDRPAPDISMQIKRRY